MPTRRLLKIRHDRTDLGFLSASVLEEEMGREPYWSLRVESPSSTEEFRDHLTTARPWRSAWSRATASQLRGEAYVSSISDGMDIATVVVLAGSGPLRRT